MAGGKVLRMQEGRIATLTLNAPETLNALSFALLDELAAALDALKTDRDIRVILLRGAGKCFSAGHDLREIAAARGDPDGGAARLGDLFARCASVMQRLPALPQPVIAEVHGIATAAGCQLVASCDLAVAASGTRFGVNGVNIGLFCSTPMVALTRKVAPAAAFELLATGAFISAERAAEIGLINRVAAPEHLAEETRSLAETLAAKLPVALAHGKAAFYGQRGLPLTEAYDKAGAIMVANLMEAETQEGIAAFLEKRTPDWPA